MIVFRARHRLIPLVSLALLALAACKEDLAGGAACPTLCPGQTLEVHDTVLVAEQVFDTTAVINASTRSSASSRSPTLRSRPGLWRS
jgi:hypothetical protein